MKKKFIVLGVVLLIFLAGANIAKTIYKDNQAEGGFLLDVVMQGECKMVMLTRKS